MDRSESTPINPIRLDGKPKTIQNGDTVSAFAIDPFTECRLAVGCMDANIRLWNDVSDNSFICLLKGK